MGAKQAKIETVADLKDKLAKARSVVMVDYRGLTVAQTSALRRKLKEAGGELLVAKNTLIKRALEKQQAEDLFSSGVLNGPTAVVFSVDEVSGANALAGFAKTVGLPKFKGGLLADRVLSAEEVENLATIPTREVLNGKLVGILAGQPTRLVWVLGGNLSKLVRALAEIQKGKPN